MIPKDVSSSASRPKVIVPRQTRDTLSPDLPRRTTSMTLSFFATRPAWRRRDRLPSAGDPIREPPLHAAEGAEAAVYGDHRAVDEAGRIGQQPQHRAYQVLRNPEAPLRRMGQDRLCLLYTSPSPRD